MNKLDYTIFILLTIFILIWITIWVKTKSFLGIFGLMNNSKSTNEQQTTPQPSTTFQPITTSQPTTTPQPTTTKSPSCISCIHGTCVDGVCICEPGYTGFNCLNQIKCLNNCNYNGDCVQGKCICKTNYTGDDCSKFNGNWSNKLYTTDSVCATNDKACLSGQCCINNSCVTCDPDMLIQNNGIFDGQKPTCPIDSTGLRFCADGKLCISSGNCVEKVNCVTSDWKTVSGCEPSTACKFGNITQKKDIITSPKYGGAECGSLTNYIPCYNARSYC